MKVLLKMYTLLIYLNRIVILLLNTFDYICCSSNFTFIKVRTLSTSPTTVCESTMAHERTTKLLPNKIQIRIVLRAAESTQANTGRGEESSKVL